MPLIRAGVGLSTATDVLGAAAEATRRATAALDGARADWCVAFATTHHSESLEALLAAVAVESGTPYVAGCSGSGVIGEGREVESGPAVGVLAVASDALRATPFLFLDEGDHGLTAGVRIGQRLAGSRGSRDLVLVWPDASRVRPDRLLEGLSATLAGVPVAGGAAASAAPDAATFQFCGAEAASGAVSGIRLSGEFVHRVAVTQGCRPVGAPRRVTRAHDNLILEIEGRSAYDVLAESVAAEILESEDRVAAAVSVALLPEGGDAVLRDGEYLVRNLLAADADTGVLAIADSVEEGQAVLFAVREPRAAREDFCAVLSRLAGDDRTTDWRFGLYFDCLARGSSLYRRPQVDTELLSRAFPGLPVLGFFCNAEMAPLRGQNRLFTYTGVLVLVGE